MRHLVRTLCAIGLAITLPLFFVGCEGGAKKEAETKKEAAPAAATEEAAPAEEAAADEEMAPGATTAMMSPAGSAGRMANDEGVGHYEQGHWDESAKHFRKAVKADPKLAVGHFNLALALDKMGDHGKATEHFKKAAELAPDNPMIVNSEILKQHTKM